MNGLVDKFREISGNGIIVSKDGETLCAVVSGEFGLPQTACEEIMNSLKAWQQDQTARIPPPTKTTPRKRTYDQRNYVSGEALMFKKLFSLFFKYSLFIFLGRGAALWVGSARRRKHEVGGTSCPPTVSGDRQAGERR